MQLGYALVVSLALGDIRTEQAALRIVHWCNVHRNPYHHEENDELCGFQVPLEKGEMLTRDCRMPRPGMST